MVITLEYTRPYSTYDLYAEYITNSVEEYANTRTQQPQ